MLKERLWMGKRDGEGVSWLGLNCEARRVERGKVKVASGMGKMGGYTE